MTNFKKAAIIWIIILAMAVAVSAAGTGRITAYAAKGTAGKAADDGVEDSLAGRTLIFIGDSRFLGMEAAAGLNTEIYCAKVSGGLKWLKEQMQGVSLLQSDILIVGFGINDLWNINNYIPYINSLAESSGAGDVYWLTVNPVDEANQAKQKYPVKNSQLCEFNDAVKAGAAGYRVIDTYSALIQHGYKANDGAHYDASTYAFIHDYAVGQIAQDLAMRG